MLDAQITWRLVRELHDRGLKDTVHVRDVFGSKRSDDEGVRDTEIIETLTTEGQPPSVLVTFDNDLPHTHRDLLVARRHLSVAVIDSEQDWSPLTDEEYMRDVVHRWARHMACESHPGFTRLYTMNSRAGVEREIATLDLIRNKRRRRRSL